MEPNTFSKSATVTIPLAGRFLKAGLMIRLLSRDNTRVGVSLSRASWEPGKTVRDTGGGAGGGKLGRLQRGGNAYFRTLNIYNHSFVARE